MASKLHKTLHIKNMVCNRCIKVIKDEFEKLEIKYKRISIGEVELENELDKEKLRLLEKVLIENGFELIKDKRVKIIENIKNTVIKTIYNDENFLINKKKFSGLIEKNIGMDYSYLSSLFSSIENITIEHFIILQKVERVKELLKYGELTLSEIAFKLGYSSVQHLSTQFKKVTGLSASEFKNLRKIIRKPIDQIIYQ